MRSLFILVSLAACLNAAAYSKPKTREEAIQQAIARFNRSDARKAMTERHKRERAQLSARHKREREMLKAGQ